MDRLCMFVYVKLFDILLNWTGRIRVLDARVSPERVKMEPTLG
jgi:hypothetical protein